MVVYCESRAPDTNDGKTEDLGGPRGRLWSSAQLCDPEFIS